MVAIRRTIIMTTTLAMKSRAFINPTTPRSPFGLRQTRQYSSTTKLSFIYWSIKTAFDSVGYFLGQTDEVKGTGVWKDFSMKREPEEKDESKDDESEQ